MRRNKVEDIRNNRIMSIGVITSKFMQQEVIFFFVALRPKSGLGHLSEIRNRDPTKRMTTGLRIRPNGHRDRQLTQINFFYNNHEDLFTFISYFVKKIL